MARVRVSFELEIEDSFMEELEKIVDHKLDYLLDLTEFPEIESVSDGQIEELDD